MKNYITPCVTLIKFKEDVITGSDNYIKDDFDDLDLFQE